MSSIDNLLNDAVEKAKAKAWAQAEQLAKEEANSRAAKVESWKHQQSEREGLERQARNKAGIDLAEEFLKEIAGPFQRFASRDDATKLANLKIILRPGKSDSSAGYSIQIECPESSPRMWHRATIDNLTEIQKQQIAKLQNKGGFFQSSTLEMLEEIIKLREYLTRVEKEVRDDISEKSGRVRDIIAPLQLPKD